MFLCLEEMAGGMGGIRQPLRDQFGYLCSQAEEKPLVLYSFCITIAFLKSQMIKISITYWQMNLVRGKVYADEERGGCQSP